MIGSRVFKWVMAVVIVPMILGLLVIGVDAYIQSAAARSEPFEAQKSDIDTLKVAVKVLKVDVDAHTTALAVSSSQQKANADVQAKILHALEHLSTDVNGVSAGVKVLDQKVDDQALRITDLREAAQSTRR